MLRFFADRLAQMPAPLRVLLFLVTLVLLWLPVALPIYALRLDTNTTSILTMPLLYGAFMVLVRWWGQTVYQQPRIFKHYGLRFNRKNGLDLLQGLGLGLGSLSMFVLQGGLGWLTWQPSQFFLPRLILEGGLIGVGVAFAEELFFRGWLLDELERDYRLPVALWSNSLLFAIAHFIRPLNEVIRTLPQFGGLLILGLALVWAKRSRQGRLGLSIGLHGGLVWAYYIVNVGNLFTYTQAAPEWVTGIDRNPLAGLVGLLFLGGLALMQFRQARQAQTQGL